MTNLPPAAKINIENDDLLEILAHRGKMLLISRVTEYDIDARTLSSQYDVTVDSLFYDPVLSGVPAWVSFEFMAQAVSALSGLTGKILGKPPMIGFILNISSMEIKIPLYKPGDIVRIRIEEEVRVGSASTFHCTAFRGETEAARANLMVMDVEDPIEYIEKSNYGK